ncbi:Protein kinase domain-containing protein [Psidium guajava]|nr:Protein kinase domain-containing protein [Psidium guajava]
MPPSRRLRDILTKVLPPPPPRPDKSKAWVLFSGLGIIMAVTILLAVFFYRKCWHQPSPPAAEPAQAAAKQVEAPPPPEAPVEVVDMGPELESD